MERFDLHKTQHGLSYAHGQSAALHADLQPAPTEAYTNASVTATIIPHDESSTASEGRASPRSLAAGNSPSYAEAVPIQGRNSHSALHFGDGMLGRVTPLDGVGELTAGGVESLQAVLQDNSAALQQELMTAEAQMEVCFQPYTALTGQA